MRISNWGVGQAQLLDIQFAFARLEGWYMRSERSYIALCPQVGHSYSVGGRSGFDGKKIIHDINKGYFEMHEPILAFCAL